MTGCFIAVVGPSGAGKDTLIDFAQARLKDEAMFRFVRRAITRPATAGGEDHEALSEADFLARAKTGGFALHWSAHGLHYGIPVAVDSWLADGACVIANLSRTALTEANRRFKRFHTIVVTAPDAVIAERLSARGRETAHDIDRRLARAPWQVPDGLDVTLIVNDGPVEETGQTFVDTLVGLAAPKGVR